MKYQSLFSLKTKKKNIINLSSAELDQSVVKFNHVTLTFCCHYCSGDFAAVCLKSSIWPMFVRMRIEH